MRLQPLTSRGVAIVLAALTALVGCTQEPAVSDCCKELPVEPIEPVGVATPAAADTSAELPADSLLQLGSMWTTDAGTTLKLAELRGKTLVVAMVFANCEYACPIIVNDLKRLDAALPAEVRADVRYVLVTFDLKRDTVEALRAYRDRIGATDDPRWLLLRAASEDDNLELAALLGVKYKLDARGQFAHTNLFTVLDREGRLAHQQVGLNESVEETAAKIKELAAASG